MQIKKAFGQCLWIALPTVDIIFELVASKFDESISSSSPKKNKWVLETNLETEQQLLLENMDIGDIKSFIKTSNGFKVVNPEGYVAIDRVSGDAVKLVDRMEFSFNNFTAIKAWDKWKH